MIDMTSNLSRDIMKRHYMVADLFTLRRKRTCLYVLVEATLLDAIDVHNKKTTDKLSRWFNPAAIAVSPENDLGYTLHYAAWTS